MAGKLIIPTLILLLLQLSCTPKIAPSSQYAKTFQMDNLLAWSIAAFDSKERNSEERIEMLARIGFEQYAYGGSAKQMLAMKQEWQLAKKAGVKVSAVWMFLDHRSNAPGKLRAINEQLLRSLKEEGLETQIWVGFHEKYFDGMSETKAMENASAMVAYLAQRAKSINCKIALYNHKGWMGEPENQLAVIKSLPAYDLGIIYNFHHSHDHLERYTQFLPRILPYLWCVSLNGVRKKGPKIIQIGKGDMEKEMIDLLLANNYKGPFAILGHIKTADVEIVLKDNIKGLHALYN